ncbi:hypothetical protein FQN50_008701 [Emmonsiellopsis sp. PD_5]|nr:hypothetical protein FQN50_008701 [Emmonsiellopsis sp. PD_5]
MTDRQISYGRGGAGNMRPTQPTTTTSSSTTTNTSSTTSPTSSSHPTATTTTANPSSHPHPHPTPDDLSTPTIKSDIYTTGRGGSGNMVTNDDPQIARRAQDVDVPPALVRDVQMGGEGRRMFVGRGGVANMYDPETGTAVGEVSAGGNANSAEDDLEKGIKSDWNGDANLTPLQKVLSRTGQGLGGGKGRDRDRAVDGQGEARR